MISIKLQSNFVEIALQHGCSPVNLLHIFRTLFSKDTSERLLLNTAFRVDAEKGLHLKSHKKTPPT